MPYEKIRGRKIYYELLGKKGKPMMLIHGWTSYHANWRHVADEFQKDYRIILPDLLGHGLSDKPSRGYSIEEQASYMIELLRKVGFKKNVILGGHSMGGMIALRMVLSCPKMFERLILVGTSAIGCKGALKKLQNDISIRLLNINYRFFYRFSIPLVFSSNATREMKRTHIANTERTPCHVAVHAYREGIRDFNVLDRLKEIRIPTLIIYGEKDRMFSYEEQLMLKEGISGSRLFLITEAGHEVLMEQPDAVNDAFNQFFQ
ncbi:MAG: alpha/beta hydrolase [Thermoplasmata archaeon]